MENRKSQVKRPGVGFFLSDLGKSIRRRRRQMLLLGVISFLSAFFLLGMYLFQENSENYLFAAHQTSYGDWCIAEIREIGSMTAQDNNSDAGEEVTSQDDDGDTAATQDSDTDTSAVSTASFSSHAYFDRIGYMESGVTIYDAEGTAYEGQVGYMDEMLLALGSVSVYYGRLPETDTEIAITMNMGAEMGASFVLGEDAITFYTIGDELTADGEPVYEAHSFTIVGILQGSCQQWATSEWMPEALVTQSALAEITGTGGAPIAGWFYRLKDEFSNVDVTELYENLDAILTVSDADAQSADDAGTVTLYVNDLLYSDTSMDSAIYYLLLKLLISAAAAAALSFLLISYIQKRRPEYYRYRTIGMSRKRVYLMMWAEGLFACIPSLVAGLVLAAIVGRIAVAVICARGEYVFEYEISIGLAFSAMLVWIVTFVLAMLLAMVMNRDRSLQGYIRPLILSERAKRHRNLLHPKHFLWSMDLRSRRVHRGISVLSNLLGVIFLGLFLFGGIRILEDYLSYTLLSDYVSNFEVSCSGESWTASNSDDDENSRLSGKYLDMGVGFTDDFLEELDSISQITCTLSTRDTTHSLAWDGMWDSGDLDDYLDHAYVTLSNESLTVNYSIRGLVEAGYALEAIGYTSWFVSNTQEIYEECTTFCRKDSSQDIVYNYEKFESGEQVFLILPENYTSIKAGDTIRISKNETGDDITLKGDYEDAIMEMDIVKEVLAASGMSTDTETTEGASKESDTEITEGAYKETESSMGTGEDADSSEEYIEVTVAGIIINNDDAITMQFPIYTLLPTLSSAGIFLVGSEALGLQIAAMDGTEYTHNYMTVNVSPYASSYVTIKECAEIFANAGSNISYENNYETLQQEWKEFLQTLGIYGSFMIFLLAFYLMLKLDMIQTEISSRSSRIRLLRHMGMEKKRLGQMYALDGVLESCLLWLPPIVVWAIRYVLVQTYILDVDEYQSLWKIYLPFAIASVVGMLILHVGARYIMIKKNLKRE